jgi:hypothetical protein
MGTGESGYSGMDNLKRIRNYQLGWLFALESNRTVALEKGQWVSQDCCRETGRTTLARHAPWQKLWSPGYRPIHFYPLTR